MKKTVFRIFSLSLILSVLGLMLYFNKLNAIGSDVTVTLNVNGGTLDCVNSTTFGTLGNVTAGFGSGYLTGIAATGTWLCTDLIGSGNWTASPNAGTGLSVLMTANLSGTNNAFIPNAYVKMKAPTPTVQSGVVSNCTAISQLTTAGNINSTKYVILKTGLTGGVCAFSTIPTIHVLVPASQSVGSYSGVITVTAPA